MFSLLALETASAIPTVTQREGLEDHLDFLASTGWVRKDIHLYL